jgi:hypothetical protein
VLRSLLGGANLAKYRDIALADFRLKTIEHLTLPQGEMHGCAVRDTTLRDRRVGQRPGWR